MTPALPPRLTPCSLALVAALLAAGVVATGCGTTLLAHLNEMESPGYRLACIKRADKHVGDVNSGRYFLPEFYVARWPLSMPHSRKIDETGLVSALARGDARFVLVTARAGLGKSRLATAIDARLCGAMPVFRVDLPKDVLPFAVKAQGAGKGKGEGEDAGAGAVKANPFVAWLRHRTGLAGPEDGPRLDAMLKGQRWVMLADALEEVPLRQRPEIISALLELRRLYPSTLQLIVLARPAVLDVNYGIEGFDTELRILPIDRARADAFLGRLVKGKNELAAIKIFLGEHGFDEVTNFGFQPIYPMMATYRDVIILRKLAGRAVGGHGVPSHAAAHEYLIGQRLAKELRQMSWGQREVLDMVDRMVAVHRERQGASTPFFTMRNCMRSIDPEYGWTAVDAGVGGDPRMRRRQVCEKALQSIIFEPSGSARGDKGVWRFAAESTADLFAARWVNGQLARLPEGDCSTVEKSRDLFRSSSIVRFLVGQPMVQRCFGHVMRVLCEDPGAKKARHIEHVISGLPRDRRLEMVAIARSYEAGHGENACVLASLDLIARAQGQ